MDSGGAVKEIGPAELKRRLDAGDKIVVLDVREPHELQICRLANTMHIPLGSLRDRIAELESHRNAEIVVYCRSGGRSQKAASFLNTIGFGSVYNLRGGILAWSEEVDHTIPKY